MRVWDLATGDPIGGPLTGHTDAVSAVAFGVCRTGARWSSPAATTRTVRVWDLATGDPIGAPLTGHTGTVYAVASATCPMAGCSPSPAATTRRCGCGTWPPAPVGDPLTGHTDAVGAVAIVTLPDGRVLAVTGGTDATVRLWDSTSGRPVGSPQRLPSPIRALSVQAPESGIPVIIGGDGLARVDFSIDGGNPAGLHCPLMGDRDPTTPAPPARRPLRRCD